jgi:hypothetical protein
LPMTQPVAGAAVAALAGRRVVRAKDGRQIGTSELMGNFERERLVLP